MLGDSLLIGDVRIHRVKRAGLGAEPWTPTELKGGQ